MSDRSKAVDRRIIEELTRDARQSNVSLGKAVGLTEGAVRRRIENLVASGTLRFQAQVDPSFLGMQSHALLRVRCAPHLIDEVIAAMRTMPELERIYLCTGQFDITAVGHFESTAALRDFAMSRLGSVDGVVEMQSELILDTFVPAPQADAAGGSPTDDTPGGAA